MHFDIDHFKQINDTLGHDAGDALLKHAAKVLTQNLPRDTLVSRVGGDEFVALLNNAPEDKVLRKIGQNIVSEMGRPFPYQGQLCNIGTSIGVALSEPGEPVASALFIDADLALYEAKKSGRGRVRFFNAEMKAEAKRRKNSFDALLEGFDQGEITCHYQPQFDTKSLKLTGVEALVRWESAKYGLIMPNEFLGTAADMGLMPEFDELVLKQALEDLALWEAAGLHVPRISVNVSSHRLNDTRLGSRLSKLDLPRGRVAFELLESAFLDSRNEVIDTNLSLLDEIGVEIEIDDFGSGHASIVSLLQIAPKRLKIDRMLIAPVVASQRQRNLVATIINIGKMLDVSVIAEGVETPDHVRIMRKLECDGLQGFGLAHPMDRGALQSFLQRLERNDGRLPDTQDA
jgi:diguanylate cyclase (GGDEF)-like protein